MPGEASAMTGAKLAALVCKHMRTLFRTRRRLLENNVEYSVRSRNPPPNKNGGLVVGSPGTGGADGGDASLRAPSVLSPPPPRRYNVPQRQHSPISCKITESRLVPLLLTLPPSLPPPPSLHPSLTPCTVHPVSTLSRSPIPA